jgi:hypothetical protein
MCPFFFKDPQAPTPYKTIDFKWGGVQGHGPLGALEASPYSPFSRKMGSGCEVSFTTLSEATL